MTLTFKILKQSKQSLSVKHLGIYDKRTPCTTLPTKLTEPFTDINDLFGIEFTHLLFCTDVPFEHDQPFYILHYELQPSPSFLLPSSHC